ncbi:hypothetical protein M8C21_018057 [Ambrosia artemisiifolia]|uniref:Phospholipase D alpha 1 n=1 Tax=Ambrosia artemisiifolia TaxID=4212 RepID=A0AAD5CB61_AMBAR|nr:hypothetical protein M8C21_018057 [Ambrosia artemisiifolia]
MEGSTSDLVCGMAEVGYYDGSQHGQSVQVIPFKTSNASLKVLLLHGNLDIWVKEAKNLPNMDMFHNKLGQVFGRLPTFSGGKNKTEDGKPEKVTSDPYVTVSIANAVIARTFVISNSENPVWMQHFYVPVAHYSAEYTPMMKVPLDPNFNGVAGTYFPLRRGGKVTLYQDAHVDDGSLPSMHLDGGLKYQNGDCWHDICEAIKQARRLIYITGWSVFHSVQLVRNGDGAKDSYLGDLLKAKSSEGVRVLLLVWDDPTSRSILGIKTQGVMQTNDEETRRFFKHSSVKVLLCPRSAGKGHSWAKKQEVETIYTHHQKTVIVDADAGNYRRRIMAFVGGLDLCVGRYDTPSHPIFSTLQTLHKDDYHQPNYTGPTTGCPREPWHDLHSRIEGPAAYDVLKNFEERWLRASKPHGIRKMKKSADDSLLKIERIPDILGIEDALCTNEQDPEGWHVQHIDIKYTEVNVSAVNLVHIFICYELANGGSAKPLHIYAGKLGIISGLLVCKVKANLADKVEMQRNLKVLDENLVAALAEINAKDEIAKKQTNIAREAIQGWVKAEAGVLALKEELEKATRQRVVDEERLRCSCVLFVKSRTNGFKMRNTLALKEKVIDEQRLVKAQLDYDLRAVYLESVKKIEKLETEAERLRLLVQKRLPGPADVARMKNVVGMIHEAEGDDGGGNLAA